MKHNNNNAKEDHQEGNTLHTNNARTSSNDCASAHDTESGQNDPTFEDLRSGPDENIDITNNINLRNTTNNNNNNSNSLSSSSSETQNELPNLPNALPLAYPIQLEGSGNENRNGQIIEPTSIIPVNPHRDRINGDETSIINRWCSHRTMKILKIVYVITLITCVSTVVSIKLKKPAQQNQQDPNPTDEEDQNINLYNNSDYNNYNNVTESSDVMIEENFTCYTDPLEINLKEIETFENGEDPSTPRTYHLCPNTHIYPFELHSDLAKPSKYNFTTGMHFPLNIFRPNISILCGHDGALKNNCTFHGGVVSIQIGQKTHQYDIEHTSAENTTIMGMTFTGGTSWYTIYAEEIQGDLTLRDCYFHNNHGIAQSLGVRNVNESEVFSLNVENCTFENNSYSHPMLYYSEIFQDKSFDKGPYYYKYLDNIGVINVVSHNPKVRVNKSRFLNNHFLSNGHYSSTSAVINISWMMSGSHNPSNIDTFSLEVTDSYFIGNTGYLSKLILEEESHLHNETEDIQMKTVYYDVRDNIVLNNTSL